jgi:hypothetical protein
MNRAFILRISAWSRRGFFRVRDVKPLIVALITPAMTRAFKRFLAALILVLSFAAAVEQSRLV